nr:beta-galactosidase 15-like [Ipomoea batatas]
MAYSTLAAFISLLFFSAFSLTCSIEVNHDGRAITLNGEPRILLSGAIHYTRSTAQNAMQNFTTLIVDMITVYALNGTSTCFFSNANETSDATINYQGVDYDVPAWSVSILPDCKKEAFNTAKVNTQTNVMVKDSNTAEQEPSSLKCVNLDKDDPIWSKDMSIRINNTGHPLHLYVNGDFIGSKWTTYGIPKSVFETKVKFRHGKNQISILSAAVGLQNYGSFFDLAGTGLSGGPVEIVGTKGDETISKDISSHKWSYKVGLHGEANKLFSNQSRFASQWQSDKLPVNSRMTCCGGAKDALTILKTACEGKEFCSVTATEDVFGKANCDGKSKRLVVEAVCSM